MRRLPLLLAALVGSVAAGGEVSVPDLPGTGCDRCLGKGLEICDHAWKSLKGDRAPEEQELDVGSLKVGSFFCSACMDMPCCQGLGWKTCGACMPAAARPHREEAIRARKEWLAFRRKEVESRTGGGLIHIRTEHFELVFGLKFQRMEVYVDARSWEYKDGFLDEARPRMKVTKRTLKGVPQHLQAHIYARRLEECWEQFTDVFDPKGRAPFPPLCTTLWTSYHPLRGQREGENKTVVPQGTEIRQWIFLVQKSPLVGLSPGGKSQKVRGASIGSDFYDQFGSEGGSGNFQPDDAFHHFLYHNVAEILVHDYVISGDEYHTAWSEGRKKSKDWRNPSLDLPDWIHEGWARVQEMDRFGEVKVQCHAEVTNKDFKAGKRGYYIKELQRELGMNRLLSMGDIGRLHLDKFTALVHMEIWGILDYLRRRSPEDFPRLIARAKCISAELNDNKEGFARALEEVYNLTLMGLDEAWREDLKKLKASD